MEQRSERAVLAWLEGLGVQDDPLTLLALIPILAQDLLLCLEVGLVFGGSNSSPYFAEVPQSAPSPGLQRIGAEPQKLDRAVDWALYS